MAVVRHNFLTGTIPTALEPAGTTLESAELADLPEIVAPDYSWLSLDPYEVHGAAEIVKVTAHAAGADTATIARGQQPAKGGSAGRLHPVDTLWELASTADDLDDLVRLPDTAHLMFVGAGTNADDSNDGLTPYSAKATIAAARTAGAVVIQCLYGTFAAPGAFVDADDITLRGLGMGLTTLAGSGSGAAVARTGAGVRRRFRLADLTIDFSAGTAGHRCLELDDFFEGSFERVWFKAPSTAAGADGTCVKFIGDAATKSTYFNNFIDCVYTSGYRCWDLGVDCNANTDTRGKFEGDGVAVYCAPASGSTGTCEFVQSKIQTAGAVLVQLGGGGGTCPDWTWLGVRVEPAGVSGEMQWNAGATRHQWYGGSVDSDATFTVFSKTLNGYWNIPQAGIYRDDRSATPGTHSLPATVSGADVVAQTIPRNTHFDDVSPLATGRLIVAKVRLEKGQTIRRIGFRSGGTPGAALTNQWFGLWKYDGTLAAVTSDDLASGWAANAWKVLAFAANYVVPDSGDFYVGIMVAGGTMPTLRGITHGNDGILALSPPMSGLDPTLALTTPATAPNPLAVSVTSSNLVYAYLSQ